MGYRSDLALLDDAPELTGPNPFLAFHNIVEDAADFRLVHVNEGLIQ